MAQAAQVDPTKMGVGRAIAVLTSGGDAQGEWRVRVPGWCGSGMSEGRPPVA